MYTIQHCYENILLKYRVKYIVFAHMHQNTVMTTYYIPMLTSFYYLSLWTIRANTEMRSY